MIYLFLVLGTLILNLFRLNEAWKKSDFSWKYFLKTNGIPAMITIITGIVIILSPDTAEDYINRVLPTFNFKVGGFSMFMFGITGDVLLKKIIALFDPSKETVVGVNNADGN